MSKFCERRGRIARNCADVRAVFLNRVWPRARRFWDRFGYTASLLLLLALIGGAASFYRARSPRVEAPAPAATPVPAVLSSAVLAAEEEAGAEEIVWTVPLTGKVVGAYRPDELVWSKTLCMWQTHAGVDVAAPLGAAVVACADGSVRDVYRDPLLGNVVVLAHANGRESLYAGLQSAALAEAGATVRAGELIGAVGNSADAEAGLGAHLHFALFENGESVEPPFSWEAQTTGAR